MSNHPYGLRGDPFASPATLSAKEASKLIRRRVRACNGDGGALFPIDTCDLIHEIAGGIPDAMLGLAAGAMRIAAAEDAPCVSPAHVRSAVEAARADAEVAPATAEVAEAPAAQGEDRAARAVDALLEAAEEAVRERTTSVANAGASEDESLPSAIVTDVDALAEDEATAETDFEDPDLPPFHPAAIPLPTQPSENLEPNARDWVSRFIPTAGAGPVAVEASHAADSPTRRGAAAPPRVSSPTPTPAPADAPRERLPAALQPPRGRRRTRRPHRPRGRRHSGHQGLLIGLAALCVIAFVVRMSLRGSLLPPGSEPARPTPTSAKQVEPRANAHEPAPSAPAVGDPTPAEAPAPRLRAPLEPAPTVRPPVPRTSTPEPASASAIVPGSVESARRSAPSAKYGLEVATFIFEERAKVERERLAASGLRARVVTTLEYGSRVYRVVLGGYADPAEAERAADSLLSNGVVLQARVVTVNY